MTQNQEEQSEQESYYQTGNRGSRCHRGAQGKTLTADDIAAAIHKNDKLYDAYYSQKTKIEPYFITRNPDIDVSELPSKFDLRDVDGKYRFLSLYRLENGNMLPAPALEDENGAYVQSGRY